MGELVISALSKPTVGNVASVGYRVLREQTEEVTLTGLLDRVGTVLAASTVPVPIVEETDEPLTAKDMRILPLPENPAKGQALIFDESRWMPGTAATELPVASVTPLAPRKKLRRQQTQKTSGH